MTGIPLVQDGVHAWNLPPPKGERLAGLGSPTPQAIERRAVDWPVIPLENPNWNRLETPEGHLVSDVDLQVLNRLGALLVDYHGMLERGMGGRAKRLYHVRVFREKQAFCAYAACLGAPQAESLYDPRSYEIGMWFDERKVDLGWLEKIFAHEMTHAYMDLAWGVTGPLWFAEGMAEYYSNFRWKGRHAVPGQVDPELVRTARWDPDFLPLAALVGMPREKMYGPGWQELYALSWTVVHFLHAEHPEIVLAFLERRPLPDPQDLDASWRAYVGRL